MLFSLFFLGGGAGRLLVSFIVRKKANVKKEQRDATGKTKQRNTKLGEAVSGDMQELRKKRGKKKKEKRKKKRSSTESQNVCVRDNAYVVFFFLFPFYICNQALLAAA